MKNLYSAGVYALIPVLFVYFFWRSLKEPAYRERLTERLGYVQVLKNRPVWVHAASVGEVQAAAVFIQALLSRRSDQQVLLTTFTPAGSKRAREVIRTNWGRQVEHCYLPLDTPGAIHRFLTHVQPQCALIVETEIWPNLFLACQRAGVPLSMISATLSSRSLARYMKSPIRKLIPEALSSVKMILAQTDGDAENFSALGAAVDQIHVIGNLKFDFTPPAGLEGRAGQLRKDWRAGERPVFAAISTHEGEEQQVIEAFVQLRKEISDLLLILVPRHPQRFDRSYRICQESKLSTARFSNGDRVDQETEVILGDTMGDSLLFMALSNVCFIGGSLVPIGGHNLLEPAALGRCVVTGPYTDSQSQLRDSLAERGGLIEVENADDLVGVVRTLLSSPAKRDEMGRLAQSVVLENQGVISKMLEILEQNGGLPK